MNWKTFKVFLRSLRLPVIALLGGLLVSAFALDDPEPAKPAAANQEARGEQPQIRDGISQLREENAKLREENAQLRKENQQLRRLLAEKVEGNVTSTTVTNSVSSVQTNQAITEAEGQLTHWFTTSSGKRHNNRCRYFKTTEGRLCSPDEGKPCKLCGG